MNSVKLEGKRRVLSTITKPCETKNWPVAGLKPALNRSVVLAGWRSHCPAKGVDAQGFPQHAIRGLAGISELFEVGGQHQNWLRWRKVPDVSSEFVAKHAGHEVINNHEVILRAREKQQRLLPIFRFGNRVPIDAEQQFKGAADIRVVVYKKDVFGLGPLCCVHRHRNNQHF